MNPASHTDFTTGPLGIASRDAQRLLRPIFIIGCNRSGSTLLFNNLSAHPAIWSLYIEAQSVFHRHFPVDPLRGEQVLGADQPVAQSIRNELYALAHNKEIMQDTPVLKWIPTKLMQRPLNVLYKPKSIRLVEKTPANSLRVPLLDAIFSDARFLFLVRRGEDVISSLMEGWKNWSRTGKVWTFTKWHYLMPPGWQEYRSRSLQEICAFQWISATEQAWNDLNRLRPHDFLLLRHEDMVTNPHDTYQQVLRFCKLPDSHHFWRAVHLNRIYTTGGSKPRSDKWRDLHEQEIESVRHLIEPVNRLFYAA